MSRRTCPRLGFVPLTDPEYLLIRNTCGTAGVPMALLLRKCLLIVGLNKKKLCELSEKIRLEQRSKLRNSWTKAILQAVRSGARTREQIHAECNQIESPWRRYSIDRAINQLLQSRRLKRVHKGGETFIESGDGSRESGARNQER